MKRTLIAMTLIAASAAISAPAFANPLDVATVTAGATNQLCDGGAASGKAKVWGGSGNIVAAADAVFTRAGFDVQCSANVFLSFQEASGNLAAVGSGSAKGNQFFSGNTNGGAITAGGKCTGINAACQDSDVSGAIDAAIAAGSAS